MLPAYSEATWVPTYLPRCLPRYRGKYLPALVTPTELSTGTYDRTALLIYPPTFLGPKVVRGLIYGQASVATASGDDVVREPGLAVTQSALARRTGTSSAEAE